MRGSEVFVPVAVDADRLIEGRQMSRVTYFVITSEVPGAEWRIPLPPVATLVGVGALGVSGVVYRTLRHGEGGRGSESDLFERPTDISALFALEGDDSILSIQLEDAWIPSDWLRDAPDWGTAERRGRHPERGLVYRVGLVTFHLAYRYTAGDIDLAALTGAGLHGGEVFFSPVETEAVRGWAQGEIDRARRSFPDKKLKLRYQTAPADA